jgi:hypothetical protein
MGGWMGVKAVLRIAYSNQKCAYIFDAYVIKLNKDFTYRQRHLPSLFLLTFRLTGMENQFLVLKAFFSCKQIKEI